MITLYIKDQCGFSASVLDKVEELGLTVTKKNIGEPGILGELVKLGGREQVPFMVDDEGGAELYDSHLINTYLEEHAKELKK